MLVGITFNSCKSSGKSDKKLEAHKVSYKMLYDYYDRHDDKIYLDSIQFDNSYYDTLVVGLKKIVKEISIYKDGTSDYCLNFVIVAPQFTEPFHTRKLKINENEANQLGDFLDSCIYSPLVSDDERWRVQIRDEAYFMYDPLGEILDLNFPPNDILIDLQISLRDLKEILEKAQE